MEKISKEILQALYASADWAASLLNYLGSRERNYRETKPETLILRAREHDGTEIIRADMIRFFRELERAGCGKYVEGRWGHSSRFEWAVKMSDVGRIAQGGEVEEVDDVDWGFSDNEVEEKKDEGNFITHEFYLRADFQMSLTLPSDLRQAEADRISDWIKTIPFE